MKHIVYNPDGNVDIKLKVELIESDQNPLTDEQKEFAEAFLNGANLCYYASLSSESDIGIGTIIDNGMPSDDSVCIEYLIPQLTLPLTLPSFIQKESQITFEIHDPESFTTYIQMIDPIPVKITPIKNGVEVEDTQAIPILKTIMEDEEEDEVMLLSLKEMKSKKIEKLPQWKTDTFTILDGDNRIENVYFKIYAIKGEPQQMSAFYIIQETMSDVNFIMFNLFGLDEFKYRANYIDNISKCMNFCGNIDVESTPKTFTYVQLRLFDSNGNDLSLNEKEYKIDFSNAEVKDDAKMITLGISEINN